MSIIKLLIISSVFILSAFAFSACSTQRALSAPEAKDLSILKSGTHRHSILAEFGSPLHNEKDKNGNNMDIFKFVQGQHVAAKAGKGVIYGLLAVGTFGISEIVTNPLEEAVGGAEMRIKINYDSSDVVSSIDVLKDERWLPIQDLGQ